jgi:glycosyltransferase involved in cell wall biosynthesis
VKILHWLGDQEMGGIKTVLDSQTDSDLTQKYEIHVSSGQVYPLLQQWQPQMLVIHKASNWRWLLNLFWLRSRFRQLKIIIQEHHYCQGFEQFNVPFPNRFRLMLRFSYALVDRVVAVSHEQGRWLEANQLLSAKKLTVIPASRNLDQLLTLPLHTASFPLRLGAYGRFSSQKGFDILIRAMREIQDVPVTLKLGGIGSQEAELRQLAQGLPNVEFVGAVKDVPAFLKSLDAVVVPSRWEPWGLTCLEAKAAGKLVFVSDVDGLKEQAQDHGILLPVGDVEKWASAIAQLPHLDCQTLGQKARSSVQKAWQQHLSAWEQLFTELLSE